MGLRLRDTKPYSCFQVISSFYGIIYKTGNEREQAIEAFPKGLDIFEEALTGKFFGGEIAC